VKKTDAGYHALNYGSMSDGRDENPGPDHANHGFSFLSFQYPVLWIKESEFNALPLRLEKIELGARFRSPQWPYQEEDYYWIIEIIRNKHLPKSHGLRLWHPIIIKGV